MSEPQVSPRLFPGSAIPLPYARLNATEVPVPIDDVDSMKVAAPDPPSSMNGKKKCCGAIGGFVTFGLIFRIVMVVVNTTKNYGKVETPHINIKTPDLADQLKGYSPPKPISKVIEDYIAERMIHHDQPDFEGNAFSNFKDQLTKSLGSKKLLRQRRGVAEIKNNFRKNKNRGSSIQKGKVLSRRLQFVLRT